MLIGVISAIGMPREPHTCNDKAAVDSQEFKAAPKLLSRKGLTNQDRLTNDELGVLHKRGLVNNIYESLKTLFYAVIILTIIRCSTCIRRNIFR
jgi:hypothetical protein